MSISFDYYYSHEAEQFTFYRIPKALFTNAKLAKLSLESKVLYGLMLDRMGLSLRSGWLDEQGRVYIYFTVKDIQKHLGCGRTKAMELLKELEEGAGLIRRKHQGQGRPDQIFVMNFVSETQTSEKQTSEPDVSPENDAMRISQRFENQTSEIQTSENRTSRVPDSEPLEVRNPDPNKNNINKTDLNDTDLIHPIYPTRSVQEMMDEMDRYEAMLKEKWGYAALVDALGGSNADGVIALGVDILMSQSPTIHMGDKVIPKAAVVKRLLALNFTNITQVFENIQKQKEPIKNMQAYLLTAFYNSSTTIDLEVTNQVAVDETRETNPNNRFLQFYRSLKG